MKGLALAAAIALAVPAFGQVNVQVQLPSISFPAPPPLVVVEPGVQVVPDNDQEVFVVDGWFWHRNGGSWFRTRTHNGGWVVVEPRLVPPTLVRVPEGRYRRWKAPAVHVAVPVQPGPPPGHAYPPAPPPPPAAQSVVQAKEIRAERVYARVIYCKEIHARDGRIARQGGGKGEKGERDWGGKELRAPEVRADTIYAKEIHADWIEAEEVHCKEVKLGR